MKDNKDMLTKEEEYMLFITGQICSYINNKFRNKPLQVFISTPFLIDAIISLNTVPKKDRAIYRNLQNMEEKKYLKYKDMELRFTRKGMNKFKELEEKLERYSKAKQNISGLDKIHAHKKLQSRLR